jgi:hypothetical protein
MAHLGAVLAYLIGDGSLGRYDGSIRRMFIAHLEDVVAPFKDVMFTFGRIIWKV